MNYAETLEYLFSRLPMFQRIGPAAYKNNLENTLRLDELYHHPHRKYKTVHVAGTNGKGSVSHMLAAILQSAGYKTGLYTSPHLIDFRERIRINGEMVSKNEVAEWVENYRINNAMWKMEPSFFELTVAMAFDLFAKHQIDIAVVEVGLGGRLDSTNIITPEVSVITNIGRDHMALLGNEVKQIAAEKAGIIKPGIPVVVGTTQPGIQPVFEEKARDVFTSLYMADQEFMIDYALQDMEGNQVISVSKNGEQIYKDLKLDLKGNYQLKNLPAVLKTCSLLNERDIKISTNHIFAGLKSVTKLTGLTGRWHVIGNNPLVVCDTAHNEDGIKAVVEQIRQTPFKNLHVVFGMVNDKEPENILKILPKRATYYFTKAQIPRAFNELELAKLGQKYGLRGQAFSEARSALTAARNGAEKNDLVFAGGSTFVVAEILE